MKATEFLNLYCADGLVKTVAAGIAAQNPHIRIKGLAGSLDAVLLAASFTLHPQDYLIVLQDREEAAYFQNDLQSLLGQEILMFPMSYKRPYEFDETENANILMRTEVLNALAAKTKPLLIVTYPEALPEKVINKRSLSSNTFSVKKGFRLRTSTRIELSCSVKKWIVFVRLIPVHNSLWKRLISSTFFRTYKPV